MTRKRYEELTPRGPPPRSGRCPAARHSDSDTADDRYHLAPLDRPLDTDTVLALAVVGAVVAWQVRTILASDVPRLRAIQTVAVDLPMLVLVFASVCVQI